MQQLGGLWYYLAARDPALNTDQRISRWANIAAMIALAATVVSWASGWILSSTWSVGLLFGLVAFLVLNGLLALVRRTAKQATESAAEYPPVQAHEVPQLLETQRVQRRSFQIEQFVRPRAFTLRRGVHLQINQMRFVDCYIYGPALIAPVTGIVGGKIFVNCTWDEEPWQRWRAPYAAGYYVGAITLQDCVFQDCHFRGVGLVMNPNEYDQKMEEYENP